MSEPKMQQLADFGQSIWLDFIDKELLYSGKLLDMISVGLRGMTSNPSIFNNAIGNTTEYDEEIKQLKAQGKTTFQIYDEITIKEIQCATDRFKELYEQTDGLDGYVSLEINPQIANEVDTQIDEGMRLNREVDRPNVMIKVPSTEAGIPVIEELTAHGINVNATLIFSLAQYEQVARAYYRGLTRLAEKGGDLSKVRSVASVFVSRIDSAVDKLLDQKIEEESDEAKQNKLRSLKGKAAVANSRIVFEKWAELLKDDLVQNLEGKNANMQRVLWASTGTKNPDYSDIKYVTELISCPTVNTLPEKTLNAFLDHGEVKNGFEAHEQESFDVITQLREVGIDVDEVCEDLLEKGVDAFDDAFTELFESIEKKAEILLAQ